MIETLRTEKSGPIPGGLAPLGVEYGSGGPLLDLKGTNSVKPGFRHPGTGADTYVTDGFRARLGDTWQM